MPKPLVNVFSKLALPQDLGPNPYDQEDLQWWPNTFAFLSFYRQLSVWKFMPKPLVNVFSKLAMSQDLGPNPYDQEDLQGWHNAFAFLSIVNYQIGNYAQAFGQRFLETGDVSRPGTNST